MPQTQESLPSLCHDASDVVFPLRRSLSELLDVQPSGGRKDNSLMGTLNATLQSRLNRAIEAESDLSAMYYLPGPDGLRRVLRAAQQMNHRPQLLDQLRESIDAYERFLESEDIGRERLHAVLGGFMPEVRESMVRANGQSAFKAMSNIIGYYAETMVTCIIVSPGTVPNRCSLTMLRGFYGWRRLRQDAWFLITGLDAGLLDDDVRITSLEGEDIDALKLPPILDAFCTNAPSFELTAAYGQTRHYKLLGDEIGARSVCDFFMGESLSNAQKQYRENDTTSAIGFASIATPSKNLLFDMLIHKDIWTDITPSLDCYRTVPQGIVTEQNWESRQYDRLELGVSLRRHSLGLPTIQSTKAPNHRRLVHYALDYLNVSADEFQGFRCAVPYPLYGTQYSMRFDLPSEQ